MTLDIDADDLGNPTDIRSALDDLDLGDDTKDNKSEGEVKTPEQKEEKEEDKTQDRPVQGDKEEDDKEGEGREEEDDKGEQKDTKGSSLITRAKAEFPNLFRKFPELQDSYFKYKEYQRYFESVESAKEASEKSEYLDILSGAVLGGDAGPLLESIAENDPRALREFSTNFLPALNKISPEAFTAVIEPVLSKFIRKVAIDAKRAGDEELLLAARYFNKHVFGDPNFSREDREDSRRDNERVQRLQHESRQKDESLELNFYTDIDGEIYEKLEFAVSRGLDPEGVLPERIRNSAIKDIITEIRDKIAKDEAHMGRMSVLRKSAIKAGFPRDMKRRIISEYLNSVKEILPSVRNRIKREVFEGINIEKKPKEGSRNISGSGNNSDMSGSGKSNNMQVPKKSEIDQDKSFGNSAGIRAALDGKFHMRK